MVSEICRMKSTIVISRDLQRRSLLCESTHPTSLSSIEPDLRDGLDLEPVRSGLACVFGHQNGLEGDVSKAERRIKRVVGDEFDNKGLCESARKTGLSATGRV